MKIILVLPKGGTKTLDIEANDTISKLKSEIKSKFSVDLNENNVVYDQIPLEEKDNERKISDIGIENDGMIHILSKSMI
jgi:hypothetical protein